MPSITCVQFNTCLDKLDFDFLYHGKASLMKRHLLVMVMSSLKGNLFIPFQFMLFIGSKGFNNWDWRLP